MSTKQHDADAYSQELTRINHHQHETTAARFTVFQALAAAGIGHEQADDLGVRRHHGARARRVQCPAGRPPPAARLTRPAGGSGGGPGQAQALDTKDVLAAAERWS
ncbi:hypothetical protein [Streptomyces syringium]|uniref:hypothetical protein n=1 Tax=Streptomyces syringium TaxID=76729 RepID=UPI0033D459F5